MQFYQVNELNVLSYMPHRWWQGFFGIIAPPAGSDHCFVAVQVNLSFKLVPQFVMSRSFHVSPEQLDLLHPEYNEKSFPVYTDTQNSVPVLALCVEEIVTWNPHNGQSEQKNNAVSYLPASSLSRYLAASLAPYTSACSTAMCLRRASFSFFNIFTSASNLASFTFSFLLASSSFSCDVIKQRQEVNSWAPNLLTMYAYSSRDVTMHSEPVKIDTNMRVMRILITGDTTRIVIHICDTIFGYTPLSLSY